MEGAGYSRALPNPGYKYIPELHVLPRFKKGPFDKVEDDSATYVALLQAQQYRYSLPTASTNKDLIPPLPDLIDSIINAWLDAMTTGYALHLATHLGYLQGDCPQARDPLLISEQSRLLSPVSVSSRYRGRERGIETCTRFILPDDVNTASTALVLKVQNSGLQSRNSELTTLVDFMYINRELPSSLQD